jgi:Delta7-sterol 5-desaturase
MGRISLIISEINQSFPKTGGLGSSKSRTAASSSKIRRSVMTSDSILSIVQDKALFVFSYDLGRYVIGAGLITALVWALKRTPIKARTIQSRTASPQDIAREILSSIRSVAVYAVFSIFIIAAFQAGIFQSKPSQGLMIDLAYLVAILLAHDAYFYWTHRAMHHPKLFRFFHSHHHKTITPTPWTAYSFDVGEAVVMMLFMPLWFSLVATPNGVIFAFLTIMILRNCMGHAGFELHPRWWLANPLTRWISTTTHHDLHHCGSYSHNYGFYFTFWDKLMGTEHPRYVERFAEVTGRPLQSWGSGRVSQPNQGSIAASNQGA